MNRSELQVHSTHEENRGGHHGFLKGIDMTNTTTVYQEASPKGSNSSVKAPRGIHHPAMVKGLNTAAVKGEATVVAPLGRSFGDLIVCPHCKAYACAPLNDAFSGHIIGYDGRVRFRLRQVGVQRLIYLCDCGKWSWITVPEVE